MSPAKAKHPNKPQKDGKAKASSAEPKAPVGGGRKGDKSAKRLEKTQADAGELTLADNSASAQGAPKVSRTKPMKDGANTSQTGDSTASAIAGEMQLKESPVQQTKAKASTLSEKHSTAAESQPKQAGDAYAPEGNESGPTAPSVVGPESASGLQGPSSATDATETPPALADNPVDLPKGALIAFRKSGGLKFSSREIVVYPDGRVTYDGGDTAKSTLTRAARRMSDAQIMGLRRILERSNFFGMRPPELKPDPDGFVVEIAGRLGGRNNHVELNAAGLPPALDALVDQLTALLPSEE